MDAGVAERESEGDVLSVSCASLLLSLFRFEIFYRLDASNDSLRYT